MFAVCSLGMFWTEHGQQTTGTAKHHTRSRSVGAILIPSKAHQGQQGEINMPSEGQGAEECQPTPWVAGARRHLLVLEPKASGLLHRAAVSTRGPHLLGA